MGSRFGILLMCTWLLSGCFTPRTEDVADPNATGLDSAANGATDAASDTGIESGAGQPDGTVDVACSGAASCTRADASRCDSESDTCRPCKVSRECDAIAGKSACIKDIGCFECSDDNNTCKAPTALCHPSRHECVACTAANAAACEADGKVCEPQSGACVECLASTQCGDANKAKCEPGKNECGKCTANDDCKHLTDTPYCNASAGKCVACTSNAECTDPKASRCDLTTNTCAGCAGPSDCINITDATSKDALPLCSNKECVQCTRAERSLCGNDVCNALTKRCEDGAALGSASVCKACVSDEQCTSGHACVMTKFAGADAGYYCQPTTSLNCTGKRPYFQLEAAITSIDGSAPIDVCTLRVSTCTGKDSYNVTDCGLDTDGDNVDDKGDSAKCGDSRFDDGYCIGFQPGVFLCTMPCNANENDCPAGSGTGASACADKDFALNACKL